MRLAYSSNAYLNFSIEETIRRIAGLGYAGLELLADVPHAWPAGLLPERKRAIRECLEKHDLKISNVNAFMMNAVADPRQPYWHPSWIEPDRHYRAIRREHTRRALQLAKELGAATIQTEPGGPLAEGQTWEAAAAVFYEEIMPCVELAEKLEVALLIEPEPGLMIETFEQYLEFAGRIESPWVGLNFDIGHAFCMKQAPEQWIARMAGHTKHYHLEDIATTRKHAHLIPGRGAIDIAAVLWEIEKSGYQGWITVELYPYIENPDDAGREAKEFVERILSMLEASVSTELKTVLHGFAEVSEWPITPRPPILITDFGCYRDPKPHPTVYVDLVDDSGHQYRVFFERFLWRLCIGESNDEEGAAFVTVGSLLEHDILQILDAAITSDKKYEVLSEPVKHAKHWSPNYR